MGKIPNSTGTSPENLGPPGVLIFENERVRVWELVLRPGETCNWHRHDDDHLFVVLDGADFEAEFSDGAFNTATLPDRRFSFAPRSARAEIARNVSSDRTFRELIIDLKEPGPGTDGPAAAPIFQDR
jgi:hypothetical protein